MSADNQQPSTVKSYVGSAAATVQNVVGSITGLSFLSFFSPPSCLVALRVPTNRVFFPGNPIDKQAAADKHVAANAERDASRAGAKAGPLNFSTSGVTVDNEDRVGGKRDQVVGSGKEFVGNALSNDSLVREGRRQNDEGQGREAAGQVKDYVGGVADRVTGTIGSVVAGVTGNPEAQSKFHSSPTARMVDGKGMYGWLMRG